MEIINSNYQRFISNLIEINIQTGIVKRFPTKRLTRDQVESPNLEDYQIEVVGILINQEDIKRYPAILSRLKEDVLIEIQENLDLLPNIESAGQYLNNISQELETLYNDIIDSYQDYKAFNPKLSEMISGEALNYKNEISSIFKTQKTYIRMLLLKIEKIVEDQKMKEGNNYEIIDCSLPFKRIRLNDPINVIVTLFKDLNDKRYITTPPKNLIDFLSNSFLDRKGEPLKPETIKTYLKPSKPEKEALEDVRIKVPDK